MLHTTPSSTADRRARSSPVYQHHTGALRTPGLLARRPIYGAIITLLGVALFGLLAVDLQTGGPLTHADIPVMNGIHVFALQGSLLVRDAAIFGSYLGQEGILIIGGLLVLYFLVKRLWTELILLLVGLLGEGGLWLFLSDYFNRPRLVFPVPVWHQMTNPSFPSGHSFGAAVLFSLLVYLFAARMSSHTSKWLIVIVGLLITLYIGISRVYVGDHYPTDILAGYMLGVAWSGFGFTLVELICIRDGKHRQTSSTK